MLSENSLVQLILAFKEGITVGNWVIFSENLVAGRVKEEENFDLHVRVKNESREESSRLMSVKVFHGRKPHYLPWIELHMIDHEIVLNNGTTFYYFGSEVEKELLSTISRCVELPRMFIDYMNDVETRTELYRGVPPVLSRLGFLLFNLGFTWFKDWYYPEGFKEGGVKLQAEKALTEEQRQSQLNRLKSEVQWFLEHVRREKVDENLQLLKPRANIVLTS